MRKADRKIRNESIALSYAALVPIAKIAESAGTSVSQVIRVVRDGMNAGILDRRPCLSGWFRHDKVADRDREIVALRRRGLKIREIAEHLGITIAAVSGVLNRSGLTTPKVKPVPKPRAQRIRRVRPPRAPRVLNPDRTDRQRALRTAQMNARYKADPKFRLAARMRASIRRSLWTEQKNGRSWTVLVGYSAEELRRHIERQFLPGMTWENMALWHVDHILPVASFGPMAPGDTSFRACWALTNLRPLWKPENVRKGARREHLI